jgi:hypothetical protein
LAPCAGPHHSAHFSPAIAAVPKARPVALEGSFRASEGKTMSNKPTHIAYVVTQPKSDLDKAIWHEVGAVWPHQNGNGFDFIVHEQISVSGRIVCIANKPRERSDR